MNEWASAALSDLLMLALQISSPPQLLYLARSFRQRAGQDLIRVELHACVLESSLSVQSTGDCDWDTCRGQDILHADRESVGLSMQYLQEHVRT